MENNRSFDLIKESPRKESNKTIINKENYNEKKMSPLSSFKNDEKEKFCEKVEQILRENPVIIEKFDIIGKIGRGGTGLVFKATPKSMKNRKVAIKIIMRKVIKEKRNEKLGKEGKKGTEGISNCSGNNKSIMEILRKNKGEIVKEGNIQKPQPIKDSGNNIEKVSGKSNGTKIEKEGEKNGNKLKINNETVILRDLKHKNLANLIGYYESETHSAIVLEYAHLGDLTDFMQNVLKRRTLSETLLCFIARQILEGLDYISKCHLIHKDIKPNNVLITEKLEVKIIDFSVAQKFNTNYHRYGRLSYSGTFSYMPLEVLKREEIDVNHASKVDLYSLGVLLYHLATGQYPYEINSKGKEKFVEEKIKESKTNKYNISEITRQYQINQIENSTLQISSENTRNFSPFFIDFIFGLLQKKMCDRMNIKEAKEHIWISKSNVIFEEKEKICDLEKFLVIMVMNNIYEFNRFREREPSVGELKYYKY